MYPHTKDHQSNFCRIQNVFSEYSRKDFSTELMPTTLCGSQSALTPQRRDHVRIATQTASTHARAGALMSPPPCLGGGISRVGQYTRYTRAPFGEEAVGSSQNHAPQNNHDTTTDEPNSLHETMKSRMVAEPWLQTHGQHVSDPHPEVVSGPRKLSAPQSRCERECYVVRGEPQAQV